MEFEEDLKKLELEAKAKAEAHETSLIAQDVNKAVDTKLNMHVVNYIDQDAKVQERIEQSATKIVDKGLKKQEHRINAEVNAAQKDENKSEFELEEDVYRAFGQSTAPTESWKKTFLKCMYNFWFVVISILCFFTLAPFYIYIKVIKTQSKVLKVFAIFIGVLLLLTCLGGLTYACVMWCIS